MPPSPPDKEIETHQQDKRRLVNDKDKLNDVIKSLEKDILALRKEIQERDETIQDKEKRIYDLKKKNQELEKFKFVLDYKIKERKYCLFLKLSDLSRQIFSIGVVCDLNFFAGSF